MNIRDNTCKEDWNWFDKYTVNKRKTFFFENIITFPSYKLVLWRKNCFDIIDIWFFDDFTFVMRWILEIINAKGIEIDSINIYLMKKNIFLNNIVIFPS